MYIKLNNGQDLPEKLPDAKMYEYFEKYKLGYESAKNVIIEHNLRLALSIAKKFTNTGYDFEELFSVGAIGLLKSIDTFDLSKGRKFSTYATRCIQNEILMFLRKNKKYIYNKNFDEIISKNSDGDEVKIEDTLYDDSSNFVLDYENAEIYRIIREIVEELLDREKELIKLRHGFYGGKIYTQKQAAEMIGVSQPYAGRLEKKALKTIRKKLISYGVVDASESDLISEKEIPYDAEDTKKYYNKLY